MDDSEWDGLHIISGPDEVVGEWHTQYSAVQFSEEVSKALEQDYSWATVTPLESAAIFRTRDIEGLPDEISGVHFAYGEHDVYWARDTVDGSQPFYAEMVTSPDTEALIHSAYESTGIGSDDLLDTAPDIAQMNDPHLAVQLHYEPLTGDQRTLVLRATWYTDRSGQTVVPAIQRRIPPEGRKVKAYRRAQSPEIELETIYGDIVEDMQMVSVQNQRRYSHWAAAPEDQEDILPYQVHLKVPLDRPEDIYRLYQETAASMVSATDVAAEIADAKAVIEEDLQQHLSKN